MTNHLKHKIDVRNNSRTCFAGRYDNFYLENQTTLYKRICADNDVRQIKRRMVMKKFTIILLSVFILAVGFGGMVPAPCAAVSGDMSLTAQFLNEKELKADISGRFDRDFDEVDLYIVVITADNEMYSVKPIEGGGAYELVHGIKSITPDNKFAKGDWQTLSPVDLSAISDDFTGATLVMVLVEKGENPLDSDNWVAAQTASFMEDPTARIPGQSFFLNNDNSNRYYTDNAAGGMPESEAAAPTAIADDSDKGDGADSTTSPEKPDIYKIADNKLFYANGSAGKLQLIDISNPKLPVLSDAVGMGDNATPLELYVADNNVFLMEYSYENGKSVLNLKVFKTDNGSLTPVATLSVDDLSYNMSRKLGDKIFIVGSKAGTYETVDEDVDISGDIKPVSVIYRSNLSVIAVNIENPASPTLASEESLSGYGSEVYLDNGFLIVLSRENWPNTDINLFNVTAADDPLATKGKITVPGNVPSEYHVNRKGDNLFVVYSEDDIQKGSAMKSFDISDLSDIKELGSVSGIAPKEALFATRFSGDRAYVVTYERKDPLWVIDISDAADPKIVGELEVPGWSEHMEFYENRLIAVGYDDTDGDRLISVALFNVEDPAAPFLEDRITPLKGTVNYSYSDAIYEDRAFYFNPASGVILFPLSYYDSGESSGLMTVILKSDLSGFANNAYVKNDYRIVRGSETDMTDIVVGMGDAAVSTIDLTPGGDKFAPEVAGTLRLAYNVDRFGAVSSKGELWAIGGDYYYNGYSELMAFDPDRPEVPLKSMSTGLEYPIFLKDIAYPTSDKAVLFSYSGGKIRKFNMADESLGDVFDFNDDNYWNMTSPMVFDSIFYASKQNYTEIIRPYPMPVDKPLPEDEAGMTGGSDDSATSEGGSEGSGSDGENTTDPDITPPMDEPVEAKPLIETDIVAPYYTYAVSWSLVRMDISGTGKPVILPEISIPGQLLGLTADGKLVTVERAGYYYPVYYRATLAEDGEGSSDDSAKEEEIEPIETLRLNILSIQGDKAVLETTRAFTSDEYQSPVVVMDKNHIYLGGYDWYGEGSGHELEVLSTVDLATVKKLTFDYPVVPMKADADKLVLSREQYYYYYPMLDIAADSYFAPTYEYSGPEYMIYDFSGSEPVEILKVSDVYMYSEMILLSDTGLYLTNGYKGISFYPYEGR